MIKKQYFQIFTCSVCGKEIRPNCKRCSSHAQQANVLRRTKKRARFTEEQLDIEIKLNESNRKSNITRNHKFVNSITFKD